MRTRLIATLAGTAAAGALFIPTLASGAPTGLTTPPTVDIVATCVAATGGHQFVATVTNPSGVSSQPLTLNDDAVLTFNGGSPGAIHTPTNAAYPLAVGDSVELQDILTLTGEAGTLVYHSTYTRPNIQGTPFNLDHTIQVEACEAAATTTTTAPPTTTTTPPPVVQPTFTG